MWFKFYLTWSLNGTAVVLGQSFAYEIPETHCDSKNCGLSFASLDDLIVKLWFKFWFTWLTATTVELGLSFAYEIPETHGDSNKCGASFTRFDLCNVQWMTNWYNCGTEHSKNSRSREFSWDLGSFFLARPREISLHISFPSRNMRLWKKISHSRLEPWDVERKNLALVSNPEMLRKKSCSRLELWDLKKKILVLVLNLEIESNKILKSKKTAFYLLVLFARQHGSQ